MATVPTYDRPTVEERALPGARQESIASPALLEAGATQLQDMGKGAMSAGAAFGAIANHMQERETVDAVFVADATLKQQYVDYETQTRDKRQGSNAKGVANDTATWFKDNISKALSAMPNDVQKKLFSQRASVLQVHGVGEFSKFESQQRDAAFVAGYKANNEATINLGAANPALVGQLVTTLHQNNAALFALRGITDPVVKASVNLASTTELHKQVIQGLVSTRPEQAQAYFEKNKEEIAGAQRAEIGKFAEQATSSALGTAAAAEIWLKVGPKSDREASNLDKMEQDARDKWGDQTFKLKATIDALHQRDAAFKSGRAERSAVAVNTAMDVLRKPGAKWDDVVRSGALEAMAPKDAKTMQDHYTDRQRSLRSASITERLQMEQVRQIEYSAAYNAYRDPDVLVGMSRAQVQALEPTLGRHYGTALLTAYDSMSKSADKLTEARIDKQALDTVFREFGFDPDKKLKLTKDADKVYHGRLGQMQNEIESEIGRQQNASKRVLSRDEKDVVARGVLSRTVFTEAGFFGWGSEQSPLASITPEMVKKVVVPVADRKNITTALKQKGEPVTDEKIAQLYLLRMRR